MNGIRTTSHRGAWNKGKLVGQKAPFKLQEIWAMPVRLQMQGRLWDLALFDRGIGSKLRACDLVKLRVRDVCHGDRFAARAMVLQQKTQRVGRQRKVTVGTRNVPAV
jgi:Tfp pilus assembly protein PilO